MPGLLRLLSLAGGPAWLAVVVAVTAPVASAAAADNPRLIPFQGTLERDGRPVSWSTDLAFALYSTETGGPAEWTESQRVRPVGGKFSVVLGSVTPIPPAVVEREPLYVGVTVDGQSLTLRQRIYPAPAAMKTDSGPPGIGSIIAHVVYVSPSTGNSTTIAEMQRRGFALCDGTTPLAQGIDNAVLTAATPNLNAAGYFLRGTPVVPDAPSGGVEQAPAVSLAGLTARDLGHRHRTLISDFCNGDNGAITYTDPATGRTLDIRTERLGGGGGSSLRKTVYWNGLTCAGQAPTWTTSAARSGVLFFTGAGETRPINFSVVWMMRVR